MRTLVSGLALALGLSAACLPALAQAPAWPSQPVKIVVPWATGGTVDLGARLVGQKLAELTGQPFVVENKPGASSTIGVAQVVQSPPDGHTLLAFESSYAILPALFTKLSWDHANDLAPIGTLFQTPMVLVVPAASPFKTAGELIEFARKNPGKLNFGSGGIGSTPHLSAELLQKEGNLKMTHIPYKGGGEALTAVISGNVDLLITAAPTALTQTKGGRARALAVTGAHRSVAFPDAPTFVEIGLRNYVVSNWYGLAAPRGTPKEVVARIHAEVVKALADPAVKDRLAQQGAEPLELDSAAFGAFIRKETVRWTEVSRVAGVKAE
jgi:tripartite-type tricarboxylate transporter receptor subunit TctC